MRKLVRYLTKPPRRLRWWHLLIVLWVLAGSVNGRIAFLGLLLLCSFGWIWAAGDGREDR